MTVDVKVEFDTKANRRTLLHKGKHVPLVGNVGVLKVVPGEYDLLLYVFMGPPGTKAKITLTPPNQYSLEIAGHPIEDTIAQGKQISGGNRFFRVKEGS